MIKDLWDNINQITFTLQRSQREKRERSRIVEKIMAKNFSGFPESDVCLLPTVHPNLKLTVICAGIFQILVYFQPISFQIILFLSLFSFWENVPCVLEGECVFCCICMGCSRDLFQHQILSHKLKT